MRVRSIELVGHPGVGNLALSFTDSSGNVFPVVVLAGANGTGKTAVLEAIHRAFEGRLAPNEKIGTVILSLNFDGDDLATISQIQGRGNVPTDGSVTDFTLKVDTNVTDTFLGHTLHWADASGKSMQHVIVPPQGWEHVFASYYSEASINFEASPPKTVTGQSLDDGEPKATRSGNKLAQSISQLLVDVRSADSEDLAEWVEANPADVPPASIRDVRFSRFRTAFDYMFPTKRFKSVERSASGLVFSFIEHGRISSLNTLSTGEKQIVFRAGFLVRNLSTMKRSIVLVDEPELSLHPEWQSRIVQFYIHLLSDPQGRHPQLFISTHSPFIVHGAAGAKPIILQKDAATGAITEMPAPHYPGVAGYEAVSAFNIDAFLASAAHPLLVIVEGETDVQILLTAWDKLYPGQQRSFEVRAALGDKNLSITLNDQEVFVKLAGRMILGVFDFDSAYNQWNGVWKKANASNLVSSQESSGLIKRHATGKAWAALLPVPSFRSHYASKVLGGHSVLSIELLFDDQYIPSGMILQKTLPLGQAIPYFNPSQKAAFAAHVDTLPASAFTSFSVVFDRISDILNGTL